MMSNKISATLIGKTFNNKCDSILKDVHDLLEKCELVESQLAAADQVYDAVISEGGVLDDEQLEYAFDRAKQLRRVAVAIRQVRRNNERAVTKALYILGKNGES
jgi:hypothetical protein